MRSILAVMAIESIAPEVRTVVEANNPMHVDHFRRADADEILVTSRLASRLLARSALYPGLTELVTDIVSGRRRVGALPGDAARRLRGALDRRAVDAAARRAPCDPAGRDAGRSIRSSIRRRTSGSRPATTPSSWPRAWASCGRSSSSTSRPMDLGLRGRTAIVGGATSGLGRASAEALAAEGCRLLIWSRDEGRLAAAAEEIRGAHGVEVAHVAADASTAEAAATVAAAAESFGTIDIVVTNAGGPPTVDPTATDAAGWQRTIQLLATTPIELTTRLLPGMRERGGDASSRSCRAAFASRSTTWSIRTPAARCSPPGSRPRPARSPRRA